MISTMDPLFSVKPIVSSVYSSFVLNFQVAEMLLA